MKIVYNKLRENAVLPYAATQMSGGLDVTAAHIEHININEVVVYLGFAMQPVSKSIFSDKPKKLGGIAKKPIGCGNYRIRFSPRSSFTGTNWILQNSPCLGDADFRGEYRLRFRAIPTNVETSGSISVNTEEGYVSINDLDQNLYLTYDEFPYKVGDRCAQMWVEEIIPIEFEEGELPNHTDRVGGFGSTNIKNK